MSCYWEKYKSASIELQSTPGMRSAPIPTQNPTATKNPKIPYFRHRVTSESTQNDQVLGSTLTCVVLKLVKTYKNPTWKLPFSTQSVEPDITLRYALQGWSGYKLAITCMLSTTDHLPSQNSHFPISRPTQLNKIHTKNKTKKNPTHRSHDPHKKNGITFNRALQQKAKCTFFFVVVDDQLRGCSRAVALRDELDRFWVDFDAVT